MQHQQAVSNRMTRAKAALEFVAGNLNVDMAAENAEVSSRQIYRIASHLLGKERYVVRDLRKMEYDSRVKLAKTLEKEVENVEELV